MVLLNFERIEFEMMSRMTVTHSMSITDRREPRAPARSNVDRAHSTIEFCVLTARAELGHGHGTGDAGWRGRARPSYAQRVC